MSRHDSVAGRLYRTMRRGKAKSKKHGINLNAALLDTEKYVSAPMNRASTEEAVCSLDISSSSTLPTVPLRGGLKGDRGVSSRVAPVNTISLRRLNHGRDTSVKLVPTGGGGWKKPGPSGNVSLAAPPSLPNSSHNAWEGNSLAGMLHGDKDYPEDEEPESSRSPPRSPNLGASDSPVGDAVVDEADVPRGRRGMSGPVVTMSFDEEDSRHDPLYTSGRSRDVGGDDGRERDRALYVPDGEAGERLAKLFEGDRHRGRQGDREGKKGRRRKWGGKGSGVNSNNWQVGSGRSLIWRL